ncbi:hypothetical protein BH23GEM6_BH23GEM6_04220 [soil metagenome]
MERENPRSESREPIEEQRITPRPSAPPPHQRDPLEFPSDEDQLEEGDERASRNPGAIRAEDTEPYLALQYVARLFKIAAMVVVVALTAEIVAGVALEGTGAILPLMAEVIRGVVLAAILWGAGDLTMLLIDVGHDVRAARVLLGRMSARSAEEVGAAGEDVG